MMNEKTDRLAELGIDQDAVLYYDKITTMKFGDPIKTVFKSSYVTVVKDGEPNLAQPRKGAELPEEIYLSRDFFPNLKVPFLFGRNKEFPVKIIHQKRSPDYIKCEELEARDRETDKLLYYVTFKGLSIKPSFSTAFPERVEKLCKELEIPYKPGTVLFTNARIKVLIEQVACYILGDLKSYIGYFVQTPHIVVEDSKHISGKQAEFRKKFMRALDDFVRPYGLVILFDGE